MALSLVLVAKVAMPAFITLKFHDPLVLGDPSDINWVLNLLDGLVHLKAAIGSAFSSPKQLY